MSNDAKKHDLATFTEIGDEIGVSYEQARRIYYQALKKIKAEMGTVREEELRELLHHLDNQHDEVVLHEEGYDLSGD